MVQPRPKGSLPPPRPERLRQIRSAMTTTRIRIAKYPGSTCTAPTGGHMERRVAVESADLLAPSAVRVRQRGRMNRVRRNVLRRTNKVTGGFLRKLLG